MKANHQIEPLFGLFWNFCINAPLPRDGVYRVSCWPHVDAMNLALGICIVYVYGMPSTWPSLETNPNRILQFTGKGLVMHLGDANLY